MSPQTVTTHLRRPTPWHRWGYWAAGVAFSFCFGAGLWLVIEGIRGSDTQGRDDLVLGSDFGVALGLYFIGKAFFVGPMLFIAARQLETARPFVTTARPS
jgi:hypothetical protein